MIFCSYNISSILYTYYIGGQHRPEYTAATQIECDGMRDFIRYTIYDDLCCETVERNEISLPFPTNLDLEHITTMSNQF